MTLRAQSGNLTLTIGMLLFAVPLSCRGTSTDEKSRSSKPPAADTQVAKPASPDAGQARRPEKLPERFLKVPELVARADAFRFLVFGDSRRESSLCSRPRAPKACPPRPGSRHGKGHRKRHKRRRSIPKPGAEPTLCQQAPEIMWDEIGKRLGGKGATGRAPTDRAAFALFTGDVVFRGSCRKDWLVVRSRYLKGFPVRRIYPIIGNHDSWQRIGEPDPLEHYFGTFPHLLHPGASAKDGWHDFVFRVGRSLFVQLCTGGYPQVGGRAAYFKADQEFYCTKTKFRDQLRWLRRVLKKHAAKGTDHVFVQYHKPSFSCSAHPPLREDQDPLVVLRQFKKEHPGITVTAFNGHNHTTEVYVSGGVLLLVAGAGGAPNYLAGKCGWGKKAPKERFWQGSPRALRYNFFEIQVQGRKLGLVEHCMARRKGRVVFEKGSTIAADGQVKRVEGACRLFKGPGR